MSGKRAAFNASAPALGVRSQDHESMSLHYAQQGNHKRAQYHAGRAQVFHRKALTVAIKNNESNARSYQERHARTLVAIGKAVEKREQHRQSGNRWKAYSAGEKVKELRRDASKYRQEATQAKQAVQKYRRLVYGPQGGVYEISKTGKKHSIGGKARGFRGGKNAANHEGGLVHHPSHDCPGGGLCHESGNENCGTVKKKP